MDVLIKGMEMPKNYPYRITIHSDGHVEEHSRYSGHGHYKAISVPEHGRCIDADKARRQITEDLLKLEINLPFDVLGLIIDRVEFLLTKAPTIVEASK